MLDATEIRSIVILDEIEPIRPGHTPSEVDLRDGVLLWPEYDNGQVIGGTARDREGVPLSVFLLRLSAKPHAHGDVRLPVEEDRCGVCVCTADGGCQCVEVQCPKR